ncbi:MAG TPA: nitrite/sulfite reductase [Cycloclasticus sp.]|jgi:sulfite reductase (NADPH) hemoprotein beta-component|nr:nitrite/sulfite reductase [Cycloclasticus sp.]
MYLYNEFDQTLVNERVEQFRDQTKRFLNGDLTEEQFRPLRLMNGLYIQTHAPMLRVNIPYGLLSSKQMRMFAHIAHTYDKGYGHFTTRQNIQFNWPKLEQVPDILADLATVQMHAIQSSGNCIRNITCDPLAGVSADEIEDPRPYCEIIRQWSTLHPEFSYLPRKFKFAVSGSPKDRAATQVHDIGLHVKKDAEGRIGFEVLVGGGLGRTPVIGQVIAPFIAEEDILSYSEAILRTYNLFGRRDNKYKARIKILVRETGLDKFKAQVDAEWETIKNGPLKLTQKEIQRVKAQFAPFPYQTAVSTNAPNDPQNNSGAFRQWLKQNTIQHKQAGYRVVFISLKSPTQAPGDITTEQMNKVADLAEQFSFAKIRTTHDQNLALTDVLENDLFLLWQQLNDAQLATPNIGTITDMICCPGLDFCSLANASSIDIAQGITERFTDNAIDTGNISLKMSGCMNGCGHHSIGEIGILGVDKKGEQWYQLTLGGSDSHQSKLGDRLGKAIAKESVVDAIEDIIHVYKAQRTVNESFTNTLQRVGLQPFKDKVYAAH